MLEITLGKAITLRWALASGILDYTRFFKINFPQEVVDKITPRLPPLVNGNYSSYNAFRLMPLFSASLGRVQKVEDDMWNDPNYDIRALVSFGYHSKSTQEDNAFGLVLTPLAKLEVKNGKLEVMADMSSYTFTSLFDIEEHKSAMYTIPPMVIRYKIF